MAAWAVGVDGFPGGGPPPVMDMKALSLAMMLQIQARGELSRGLFGEQKKHSAKRR
jgi:hypothetical protein